eukprot:scaffold20224_cov53-Attheya_sp.AAC.8
MDDAVHGWWSVGWTGGLARVSGMAAEVEIATCSAACLGFGEVRGVTVDLEAHVARVETNGGFGFGGALGNRELQAWWSRRHGHNRGECPQFLGFVSPRGALGNP